MHLHTASRIMYICIIIICIGYTTYLKALITDEPEVAIQSLEFSLRGETQEFQNIYVHIRIYMLLYVLCVYMYYDMFFRESSGT